MINRIIAGYVICPKESKRPGNGKPENAAL